MRRTYGTGSVRQLPSGRWQGRVRDPRNGRPVSRTFPPDVRTQRGAERALVALVAEVQAGTVGTAGPMTFGDWIDQHLTSVLRQVERGDKSPETYRSLKSRLGWIKRDIGSIPLERLATGDLDAMYERLLAAGRKASTVREYHHAASGALFEAKRLGRIPANPAEHAWNRRRVERREVTTPEHSEVSALIHASEATDPMLAAAIEIAAITGCREGEIMALRWRDVDWTAGHLVVAASVKRGVDGTPIVGTTKTRVERFVDLGTGALMVFDRIRRNAEAVARDCGCPDIDGDCFVITWADYCHRQQSSTQTLMHRYRKLAASLGLDSVRFHDLRDHAGRMALESGVDVGTIAQRLGHSPQVAHDRYLRGRAGSSAGKRAAELVPDYRREISS